MKRNYYKFLLFNLVFFSFLFCFSQDRITGELFSTRSEIIAQKGMVATSHPLATQIGLDILKKGGYLTIIVKNIKKGGKIYPLAWDLAKKLDFFTLKDEKIWCQDNVKLAPYGYGYSWVSNTVHNYCLIFKKE